MLDCLLVASFLIELALALVLFLMIYTTKKSFFTKCFFLVSDEGYTFNLKNLVKWI